MTNQITHSENTDFTKQSVCRLGFWIAILTAVAAAAALVIAVTTAPPRSGPFCMLDSCITYPYTDAAIFVSNDYLWMYPAFLMSLLFVVLVICIHHYTSADKRVFSQVALSFAVISATVHTVNYFIQLAVIQPSLLKGELQGLSLFSQYNPHGIFIALEDAGYLMMGVAFLFIALVFSRRKRLENGYIFIISSMLAVGSLILIALVYGSDLEYRYEVVVIVIVWITLIVSGALLSLFFKRAGRVISEEEMNRIGGISR